MGFQHAGVCRGFAAAGEGQARLRDLDDERRASPMRGGVVAASHDFPLDSIGRVTRSLGSSPRQLPAQRHARVYSYAIGQDPIENHFASQDRPSLAFSESPKTRV